MEDLFKEETDEKTEHLIETFEKAGGEVDFVFLTIKNTGIKDRFLLSRKAVVHAMTILAGRLDEQYLVNLKLSREERNKLFKIVIHNKEPALAFAAPPYRLKMTRTEINELFIAFNDILFKGETPYIVLWDNNWSNYFDKGKSWWGGYMWSLLFEQGSRCVVIGASAID